MSNILVEIEYLLSDEYLIHTGNIDTLSYEAIFSIRDCLSRNGAQHTEIVSWEDHIATFAWIENNKPQLLVFKFK